MDRQGTKYCSGIIRGGKIEIFLAHQCGRGEQDVAGGGVHMFAHSQNHLHGCIQQYQS